MHTLNGVVFGIEIAREEIRLLFGSRTVRTGRDQETLLVSERIILNPYVAKRLLVLLRKWLTARQLPSGMDAGDLRAFIEAVN